MVSEARDPGPMARLRDVKADPAAGRELLALVEQGKTFPQIASMWGVPRREFLFWLAANAELTEECKRLSELAGIWYRAEGLEIVDEATPENAAVAKLQAEYRERLSRDLNKPLFGKTLQHKHSHVIDLGERLRRATERVIEPAAVEALPELARAEPEPVPRQRAEFLI